MNSGDAMFLCCMVAMGGALATIFACNFTSKRWVIVLGAAWFCFWTFPGFSYIWLKAVLQ